MCSNDKRSFRGSFVLRNALYIAGGIFFVVLFTTIVLRIAGAPAFSPFYHLFAGSLGSWSKIGHVIKAWIPLTLCACGLLYTFRIGLLNLGIEGQVIMGAVMTTFLLRLGMKTDYPLLFLILSFPAGMIGGAIWALFAGFLKTRGGVNEIFAGLGLNFVAQGIVLWLIFGPWKRPGIASMSGTEPFPSEMWLDYISAMRISPVSLTLVIAAVIITALIMSRSVIGLKLKAAGNNPQSAYLFGIKPARHMLIAMIFAGGFAGLAGNLQVTGVYHRLIPAISSSYGYLSLLVVMLAGYNVWAAAAVAFFFACLNVGSIQLPMMLQIDSSLSGVIQGTLVLAALAIHAIHGRKAKLI